MRPVRFASIIGRAWGSALGIPFAKRSEPVQFPFENRSHVVQCTYKTHTHYVLQNPFGVRKIVVCSNCCSDAQVVEKPVFLQVVLNNYNLVPGRGS